MGILATLRNTVNWAGFRTSNSEGASALGVTFVDPNAGTSIEGDQVFEYNSDNTLKKITVTNDDGVFVQTYSYTAGKLTGVSRWVRQ